MTTHPTLIQILRSNTFAIYIAIASVIVQSFHSFYAFYKISSLNGTGWGIAQAVLFAIIVDAAVLFYTVRKNTKVTWMAAFVMVLINLYVYWTHLGMTFDFILGVLISFVIPVSNYFYSEEIDDGPALGNAVIWNNDEEKLKALDGLNKEVVKLSKELDGRKSQLVGVRRELEVEQNKSTKYITELREVIKEQEERLKKMVPIDNPQLAANDDLKPYEDSYKPIPFMDDTADGKEIPLNQSEKKGFASLHSPAQEVPPIDKSLLGVDKIVHTDRPNP